MQRVADRIHIRWTWVPLLTELASVEVLVQVEAFLFHKTDESIKKTLEMLSISLYKPICTHILFLFLSLFHTCAHTHTHVQFWTHPQAQGNTNHNMAAFDGSSGQSPVEHIHYYSSQGWSLNIRAELKLHLIRQLTTCSYNFLLLIFIFLLHFMI